MLESKLGEAGCFGEFRGHAAEGLPQCLPTPFFLHWGLTRRASLAYSPAPAFRSVLRLSHSHGGCA